MKKIFTRPKASSDLDEQALFIAQDNQQAAYQLYEACEQHSWQISENASNGPEISND